MAKSTTGIVTATTLNVRPEPTTSKPAIGSIPRGTIVTIQSRQGVWYQIKAGTLEGFVHSDYIKLQEAVPVAGFLFERDELRDVHPASAEADRIPIVAGYSAQQKLVANVWNNYGGLVSRIGDILAVDPAAAVAIICVESSGIGMGPDGRMIIRFENHIFWKEWGKKNPTAFNARFRFNQSKQWLGHQFRAKNTAAWENFHGNQISEWRVFEAARSLNEVAALRSISMGLPQIMGFNAAAIGYDSVGEMFAAFQSDIRYQILGLFDFVKGAGTTSAMLSALQRKNYDDFAARYNGPGQAAIYGARIASHVGTFESIRPHR